MAGRAGGPVAAKAFWDSSALVPLCVKQPTTSRLLSFYRAYAVVMWWATPIEIFSGLARLLRMSSISTTEHAQGRRLATLLVDSASIIQPSDTLRKQAGLLVEQYDLRAGDGFQLAAALEWCGNVSQSRVFFTTDRRLGAVAVLTGFDVRQI